MGVLNDAFTVVTPDLAASLRAARTPLAGTLPPGLRSDIGLTLLDMVCFFETLEFNIELFDRFEGEAANVFFGLSVL